MYPGHWAARDPDKLALVMIGEGGALTNLELESRSRRLAQYWNGKGLRPGDHVAIFAENTPEYFEVYWAAMRSGFYLTPVNRYLQAEEAGYILSNSGARSLIATQTLASVAIEALKQNPQCIHNLLVGGETAGFDPYEQALASAPDKPLPREPRGEVMVYSSGTTGRPKGIKRPLSGLTIDQEYKPYSPVLRLLKNDEATRMLVTAPLYHTAPLGHAVGAQSFGGGVYCMDKFDPEAALAAIEHYRITHAYWVPTMFVRLLKLPDEVRRRYDISSLEVSIHTAAPCPVDVKKRMLDWFGPTIYEYYGGSEFTGLTWADPLDWLKHPGTVGKAMLGIVRVCDDAGAVLEPGQNGTIYFENASVTLRYHEDPDKTTSVQHPEHADWTTLGDVGYLDAEGWLYLTDRKTFMIIAGGVNIYPQEIEDCLIQHAAIEDVAIIGVPNADLGEEVKAVVQLRQGVDATPALAADIIAYARTRIAHFKAPRSVDFVAELPRLPTGKLYKRLLRDQYWAGHDSKLA